MEYYYQITIVILNPTQTLPLNNKGRALNEHLLSASGFKKYLSSNL